MANKLNQMDSSSDEEDNRHNLIEQNVRKPATPPIGGAAAATFHVEDFSSRFQRFNLRKSNIFAILAVFAIILVFSFASLRRSSKNLSSFSDSLSDRMKESELRALSLLREQQLVLLSVWNQTFRSNTSDSDLHRSSEDLKSAVFKQISVNREIQQVLVQPHRIGNTFEPEFDFVNLVFFHGVSYNRCRTVDQNLTNRRTIDWNPKSGKFLLAVCLSGQMSNHLICLEKHMFFAALLGRVLVIP